MKNDEFPYQKQWQDYKRRRVTFWLVFVSYIPFMFLFVGVLGNLIKNSSFSGDIGFIGFIFFGFVWTICGLRLQYWKCPRCGKAFHTKWWWNNIFSSKCLHCKLPKYEGSSFYYDQI